jgi:hypothetical protein
MFIFASVAGPAMPSAASPFFCWKSLTAFSVPDPNVRGDTKRLLQLFYGFAGCADLQLDKFVETHPREGIRPGNPVDG